MTGAKRFARVLCLIFLTLPLSAGAHAAAPPFASPVLARILDFENGSAAGLLFLAIDQKIESRFKMRPAWQSHDRASVDDAGPLADEAASGAFDIVITGDEAFVEEIAARGALLDRRPLFRSELILLGLLGNEKKFDGKETPEIMKALFDSGKIFFTPMGDAWITAREALLWREAGVSDPGDNVNYVESGRGGLSLLLQVEEEGGYTLATTGAFAQYMTSTRAPEPLVRLAGTGFYQTHYLCLIDHRGFRQERAQNAQKLAGWLIREEAARTINDFTLSEIRPFRTK